MSQQLTFCGFSVTTGDTPNQLFSEKGSRAWELRGWEPAGEEAIQDLEAKLLGPASQLCGQPRPRNPGLGPRGARTPTSLLEQPILVG